MSVFLKIIVVIVILGSISCVQKGIVGSATYDWAESRKYVEHRPSYGYEIGVVGREPIVNPLMEFLSAGLSYSVRSLELESGADTGYVKVASIDPSFGFGIYINDQFYFTPTLRFSIPVSVSSELGDDDYPTEGIWGLKSYAEMDFAYRVNQKLHVSAFMQVGSDIMLLSKEPFYDGTGGMRVVGLRMTYLFEDQ
ncbi:hypothetical protein [Bdellovibrio sp. HCB209]|uniref:hypothetical protein n=1 Tax=Bdellovibrio sp. HCB209 TaxID=3394354 RepID=UPI0039B6BD85